MTIKEYQKGFYKQQTHNIKPKILKGVDAPIPQNREDSKQHKKITIEDKTSQNYL